MSKEWFDAEEQVLEEVGEESKTPYKEKHFDPELKPGNLSRWNAFNGMGKIVRESSIKENGPFMSSNANLVNPYTGFDLGITLNHSKGCPYYVTVINYDGQSKHPSFLATMSPRENDEIMRIIGRPLQPADKLVWEKFEAKVGVYNKNYPNDIFCVMKPDIFYE